MRSALNRAAKSSLNTMARIQQRVYGACHGGRAAVSLGRSFCTLIPPLDRPNCIAIPSGVYLLFYRAIFCMSRNCAYDPGVLDSQLFDGTKLCENRMP